MTNGAKTAGKKGISVLTQGKGNTRIHVIVANKIGNITAVTKGGRSYIWHMTNDREADVAYIMFGE